MFTALEFSQFAASAWAGPAAASIASVEHYTAPSGHKATTYTISYHAGEVCHYGRAECPFQAAVLAVAHFATTQPQPVALSAIHHCRRIIEAYQAELSGCYA